MICFNCQKQIPDESTTCPNCGAPVVHQVQIRKEIGLRRFQRWGFYVIIAVVFLGMTAGMVAIYAKNTKLVDTNTKAMLTLKTYQENLVTAQQNLTNSQNELTQKQTQLSELEKRTQDYQAEIEAKNALLADLETFKAQLDPADANVYAALIRLGVGVSPADLSGIMLADYNLAAGVDTDYDGLSDTVETALGTDSTKADTDADTYSDKTELLAGFDPTMANTKFPVATDFIKANKGNILLQVDQAGQAWYLSPTDSKKYFLGTPAKALENLEKLNKITPKT